MCLARFDAHFIGNEVFQPGMQLVIDDLMSATGQQILLSPLPARAGTYGDVVAYCRDKGHIPLGLLRGPTSMLNPPTDTKVEASDRVISVGVRALS